MKINLSARIAAAKTAVTIASAWARLGLPNPPPEGNRVVRPPDREDESECFSIFLAKDGWQRFKDHKTGATGDLIDFVELVVKEGRPAAIQRVLGWAGDTASLSGGGTTSLSPPPQVISSPGRTEATFNADRHARLQAKRRSMWPAFSYPSQAAIQRIADIRRLDPAAVEAIARAGLLKTSRDEDGHDVYVIHEGAFAQYRRLDGELFRGKHKVWNPKGSETGFIGRCLLGTDTQAVLLTEGVVGLLESTALIGGAENGWNWTALVATSSGSRFATAPDLLAKLAGRVVCIVPDEGVNGAKAAASWRDDLRAAGASVDIFHLPDGHADLGTIAQNPADYAELISQLFEI
jgi:hypothetical protein